jgi:hypothetical protein
LLQLADYYQLNIAGISFYSNLIIVEQGANIAASRQLGLRSGG